MINPTGKPDFLLFTLTNPSLRIRLLLEKTLAMTCPKTNKKESPHKAPDLSTMVLVHEWPEIPAKIILQSRKKNIHSFFQ
jgi:hypothetical protein